MKSEDDYQRIAPLYDLILNPFLDSIRRDICRLLLLQKVVRAVDLGCGTGRQCALLHEHGINASGVDRSSAMLERARNKTVKDIEYYQEDLTATSLRNKYFDAAIISLALHEHEPETQNQIIREAIRIVKPTGFLAFLDHGKAEGVAPRVMHYLACVPERLAGRKHFRNYLLFMKNYGLQGLLSSRKDLRILRERGYLFGGLWLCLTSISP